MIGAALTLVALAIVFHAISNRKGFHHMSAATDRLTASLQALSVSVDALDARAKTIPAPPLDETPITQAADAIDVMKTKIDATLATPTAV